MFQKVTSKITGGLLSKQKDNDRVIIVYHWNSCGHCRAFMPILHNLLNQEKDLLNMANIFEVEYDNFKFLPQELTNVSAFPSVISIEKGQKKDEFSEQRTPEKLKEFITANKSLSSPSTTTPKSSKRQLRVYTSKK